MYQETENTEKKILGSLAAELNLEYHNVSRVVELLDEGNTIPFIARYRKEISGGMTDEELRLLSEKLAQRRNLEKRREDILRLLAEQDALTPEIESAVQNAAGITALEDIYRPFRPRRRTRATIAREKGLEPLAQLIMAGEKDLEQAAPDYINAEKEVLTAEDALSGARDIIAEIISDEPKLRPQLRSLILNEGIISSSASRDAENNDKKSIYEMYYDYREPCKKIQPHRILAMNRGEKENVLQVKIEVPAEKILLLIQKFYIKEGYDNNARLQLLEAINDSWKRLLFPSLEREIRNALTLKAEEQALKVFQDNLRSLLMVPPVRGKRILAIDPGLRTGCKIACVDETGKLLETAVIFPTPPRLEKEKSAQTVLEMIKKHNLNAIAIGNGTGGRETETFIAEMLEAYDLNLAYTVVNEAGASVYSASKLAKKEFPDLDVSERGAVSIARRIQDPLSELVKIEPRAVGVGQYQHDLPPKQLDQKLSEVVESAVNYVGVDLNTASAQLLSYVAGIKPTVADNIVHYRDENGAFMNRRELTGVPRLGPKTFEQCVGFLRISNGENRLDATAIHPESYDLACRFLDLIGAGLNEIGSPDTRARIARADVEEMAAQLGAGIPTLRDIADSLTRPGRDPREDLPLPVFRTDILSLEDLQPGMELTGTVRNVVDFGAFVDIGIKNDGLVHISELSDTRVQHPLNVVSVGDVVKVWVLAVDLERGRVSLSMKNKGAGASA